MILRIIEGGAQARDDARRDDDLDGVYDGRRLPRFAERLPARRRRNETLTPNPHRP